MEKLILAKKQLLNGDYMDFSSITVAQLIEMTPFELGRDFFMPFIMVFLIFWAILEKLRIFDGKTNIVLSLAVSIMLAITPAFAVIAVVITQYGALSALAIFGILFIGGSLVWGLGRGRDVYGRSKGYERKLIKLGENKDKLMKKHDRERDDGKREAIWKVIEDIERKEKSTRAKARSYSR